MMHFFGSNAIATVLMVMVISIIVPVFWHGMSRIFGKGAFWSAMKKGFAGMRDFA